MLIRHASMLAVTVTMFGTDVFGYVRKGSVNGPLSRSNTMFLSEIKQRKQMLTVSFRVAPQHIFWTLDKTRQALPHFQYFSVFSNSCQKSECAQPFLRSSTYWFYYALVRPAFTLTVESLNICNSMTNKENTICFSKNQTEDPAQMQTSGWDCFINC